MANIVPNTVPAVLWAAALLWAPAAQAQQTATARERLVAGYPGIVTGVDGNAVMFAGGAVLPWDDGAGPKTLDAWLAHPDIEDMFAKPYAKGQLNMPPGPQDDPGRARNEAFFVKVYGDCRKGETRKHLVDVVWLPRKKRQILKVTSRNGVADRLRAVSQELDALPEGFDADLKTSASAYNCRSIAGTQRLSGHGFGIAIDIAVRPAGYWRWQKDGSKAEAAGHSRDLPAAIVDAFEKHGFIWGGKWRHYDTMHFEYRPELLPPEVP